MRPDGMYVVRSSDAAFLVDYKRDKAGNIVDWKFDVEHYKAFLYNTENAARRVANRIPGAFVSQLRFQFFNC